MSFILLPVYSYYLAVSELGELDYMLSLIALLVPIVGMQLSDSAYRWMVADDSGLSKRTEVMYDTLLPTLLMCMVAVGSIFVFSRVKGVDVLLGFASLLMGGVLFSYFQQLLRGVKRFNGYAIVGFLQAFLTLAFSVLVLLWLQGGVRELILAQAAANCVAVIVSIALLRADFQWSRVSLRLGRVREYLIYSGPLMANAVGWWLLLMLNRIIVVEYLGYEESGIYAIASRYSSMVAIVNSVILLGIQDRVLEGENDANSLVGERGAFERFLKIEFLLLMILCAMSPLIMLTVDENYYKAWIYLPILFAASVLSAFAAYIGLGYQRVRNTNGILVTNLLGAMFSVIFTVVLIERIGLYAASVGTLLGFAVMLFARQYGLRKDYNLGMRYGFFVKGVFFWMVLYALQLFAGQVAGYVFGVMVVLVFSSSCREDIFQLLGRFVGNAKRS